MYQVPAIVAVSAALFWYSRRALRKPSSHGFYRFFAWEAIAVLLVINLPFWFDAPASALQLASWTLLTSSIGLALSGFFLLRSRGGRIHGDTDSTNFAFENTSMIVTTGIYRYIRHPLYSSLLLLAWGAYLKAPSRDSSFAVFVASLFLFITARVEEGENLTRFGEQYAAYMKTSRMFIPFLF